MIGGAGGFAALVSCMGALALAASPQTRPAAPPPTVEEARAAYERGDCAAALPVLESALAARPDDPRLRYQTGFCLDLAGSTDRAREYKQRAAQQFEILAAEGSDWEPFYYLAAFAGNDLGNAELARARAQEGLSRLPPEESLNGVGCFKASRLAGFAGRPEEARLWMRRAAGRFARQENPPAIYAAGAFLSAGEAAFEAGEYAHAGDWLERAARSSPSAYGAWYLAGAARLRLGDREAALSDFRRLDREPERTEAQYAVRLLEKVMKLADLPARLPDGREIASLSLEELGAALAKGCGGEWQEASRPAALALLAERLRRGYTLREAALAGGCIDLLFR
jgi:tetratricopeptide (TPR) repeat protein